MTAQKKYETYLMQLQLAVQRGNRHRIKEVQDEIDHADGWDEITHDLKLKIRDTNEQADDILHGHNS